MFLVKDVNLETIIDMLSLHKIWQRSGYNRTHLNGIAERAVRRIKEGTSAVLLQSGLDGKWWADSMECWCCLRNIQDLLSDGKSPYERRFGEALKGPTSPFGSIRWSNITLFLPKINREYINLSLYICQRLVKTPPVRQESFTRNISWVCIDRGWNLERRHFGRRH